MRISEKHRGQTPQQGDESWANRISRFEIPVADEVATIQQHLPWHRSQRPAKSLSVFKAAPNEKPNEDKESTEKDAST